MECPCCRAELREGRRLCDACGALTGARSPSCGQEAAPDAKFCSACGRGRGRARGAGPVGAWVMRPSAERGELTVMFCDLVGSTARAPGMDSGDLRGGIGAYRRCVAETVGRFEGF